MSNYLTVNKVVIKSDAFFDYIHPYNLSTYGQDIN